MTNRKIARQLIPSLNRSLICFIALVVSNAGFSNDNASTSIKQAAYESLDQLKFQYVEDRQLGSIGSVRAIAQDNFGFMWFGGSNGLSRWDGYTAQSYFHKDNDAHSISTNSVNALAANHDGDLWIGTYWGLNRYDSSTERFYRYLNDPKKPRSLGHNSVLSLIITDNGKLWLGTSGGGLMRYTQETDDFDIFTSNPDQPNSLAGNSITTIAEDSEGLLWVGIKNIGVDVFDPKSKIVIKRFRHNPGDPKSLSNQNATKICRDSEGSMWVGTYNGLNKHLGGHQFKHYVFDPTSPHSLRTSNIHTLEIDNAGRLWIGTGDKGLSVYNKYQDNFLRFFENKVVVDSLFVDSSGVQWVGMSRGGVARADRYGSAIKTFVHEPDNEHSLSDSHVRSLVVDNHDNLWVGTNSGLHHTNLVNNQVERHPLTAIENEGLTSPSVSAILTSQYQNKLWLGTPWGGLVHFDLAKKEIQTYMPDENDPNSLLNREVWSVYRASDGTLWVGTNFNGLNRYRPDTDDFQRYQYVIPGVKASGRVVNINGDSTGALWISTDSGLFRLKKQHQSIEYQNKPMSELFEFFGGENTGHTIKFIPSTRHAFEDSKQNMWFATYGMGAVKWDRNQDTLAKYTTEQGLIHDNASAITEDDYGFIWISTDGGISRLDPTTNKFSNFTTANGLPGDTFGYGTAVKLKTGKIAFGGLDGLTIMDPNKVYSNDYQAPLVMTRFFLFSQPILTSSRYIDTNEFAAEGIPEGVFTLSESINLTKKIILRHDQSVFTFEFSLLNYDISENNQYSYMLEGFDSDWTKMSKRRTATYTNLDPGTYTFRVRSMNNEEIPMHKEIKVAVTVLPPWWETWWAYSLYLFGFICATSPVILSQISKRRFVLNQNRILEEKVNQRTKDLIKSNEKLNKAYKQVEDASYRDPLTQLRNRRFFYDTIPEELNSVIQGFENLLSEENIVDVEGYLGFFLLDIDNFKSINDQFGHKNGDLVIQSIGRILQTCTRQLDTTFRWGGEEFLVLYHGQTLESIPVIAERIRHEVEKENIITENNIKIRCTCSIGFSYFPFDPKNPNWLGVDQIIDLADKQLYKSKNSGRNSWHGLILNESLNESADKFIESIDIKIQSQVVRQLSNTENSLTPKN